MRAHFHGQVPSLGAAGMKKIAVQIQSATGIGAQLAPVVGFHGGLLRRVLTGAHKGKGILLALAACRTTDVVDANHHVVFPRHGFLDYCFHTTHSFAVLCSVRRSDKFGQLFHRDAEIFVALRAGSFLCRIAQGQDIHRLQSVGNLQFPTQPVRVEIADPHGAEAQGFRLQHHVVGDDGRVSVGGVEAVVRAHPGLIARGAHHDGRCGAVQIGGAAHFGHRLRGVGHQQVHRLAVAGRRRDASGFQNLFKHVPLHAPFLIGAHRRAPFGQIQKFHSNPSFHNLRFRSTFVIIISGMAKRTRMYFFGRYYPNRK